MQLLQIAKQGLQKARHCLCMGRQQLITAKQSLQKARQILVGLDGWKSCLQIVGLGYTTYHGCPGDDQRAGEGGLGWGVPYIGVS